MRERLSALSEDLELLGSASPAAERTGFPGLENNRHQDVLLRSPVEAEAPAGQPGSRGLHAKAPQRALPRLRG